VIGGAHINQGTRATGTRATGTSATGTSETGTRATGTRATGTMGKILKLLSNRQMIIIIIIHLNL